MVGVGGDGGLGLLQSTGPSFTARLASKFRLAVVTGGGHGGRREFTVAGAEEAGAFQAGGSRLARRRESNIQVIQLRVRPRSIHPLPAVPPPAPGGLGGQRALTRRLLAASIQLVRPPSSSDNWQSILYLPALRLGGWDGGRSRGSSRRDGRRQFSPILTSRRQLWLHRSVRLR
jgi:hypothetical protein